MLFSEKLRLKLFRSKHELMKNRNESEVRRKFGNFLVHPGAIIIFRIITKSKSYQNFETKWSRSLSVLQVGEKYFDRWLQDGGKDGRRGSSLLGNESLRPWKKVWLLVMGFQGKTDRNKLPRSSGRWSWLCKIDVARNPRGLFVLWLLRFYSAVIASVVSDSSISSLGS